MYYAKIGNPGDGFTNQIFALITSIMIAYENGEQIVIVDNFLNDISKTTHTPISQILNIDKLNAFLQNNYNTIIIDKNNINFEIISVKYGTDETNFIDLTDYIKEHYFNQNKLFISKDCCFNDIKGDPCVGVVKKLFIKYKIDYYDIVQMFDENLNSDINIHFDGPYIFKLGFSNTYYDNMFDKILANMTYTDDFMLKSQFVSNKIDKNKKINVIHLRIENDAILHWSKFNNITPDDFKECLKQKYIDLIIKYISKEDETIILSSSLSNEVVDFLSEHNYNYKFIYKFFDDREKNAIIDLLVSKCCNNIFIGNFNIKNNKGSSFSYYLYKHINDNVIKIFIDLDHIYDNEVVVKKESIYYTIEELK